MDVDLPCHDLRDHRDGVAELAEAESDILSSQASRRPTDFVRRNCIVVVLFCVNLLLRGLQRCRTLCISFDRGQQCRTLYVF